MFGCLLRAAMHSRAVGVGTLRGAARRPRRVGVRRPVKVDRFNRGKDVLQMRKRTLAAARGFTLLEVMIVIVIILAIMAVVTVNLMGRKKQADAGTAQIQMNSLRDA